jgi:hypothetical protein
VYREYFISTPLLYAAEPLRFGECKIHLRGSEERSFIDGPSAQEVDDAFDFVYTLATYAHIPGLCIQVRGQQERDELTEDPHSFKKEDWTRWAFAHIPLRIIPLVKLDQSEFHLVQTVLNSEAE